MEPQIIIIDEQQIPNPEDQAMLQALYSRSAASVTDHLEKVKKSGSGKFMESFYVGYGHESIGDCGSTTIFCEKVSILAAKAIQDWPLYSGQETSTRYIDMSKQLIADPVGTAYSKNILDSWMNFYKEAQAPLSEHIKILYPRKESEKEAIYNKAVNARVFDILRSFLPAGINTQLAWHTNLRQAAQKLALLNHHPDSLICRMSNQIHSQLKQKYPHSFGHKLYQETEDYRHEMVSNYTYFSVGLEYAGPRCTTSIKSTDIKEYERAFQKRPPKAELPSFLMDLGLVTFEFPIDFGSFRDIQRHRNGVCRMPLLTTEIGFHSWYIEQLPESLREQAEKLIKQQTLLINEMSADPVTKQYYTALGYQVACKVTYGLPAAVYTIELRSGKTVHPTLRRVAHWMKDALQEKLPEVVIHTDTEEDEWDLRRGTQDIVEKLSTY